MTIRPNSKPSMVLMDSYLDHYTTHTRLIEQLKLLRAKAEIADEEDKEEKEVVQEANVYLTSIAKTNNEVHLHPKSGHSSDEFLRQAIEHSALKSNGDPHDGAVPKFVKEPGSGDIGIQITASRLETIKKTGSWTTKPCQIRKRKNAKPREYLCIECGTKESPEWRTGARGRKTLCNACGLRWAKTSKHEVLECAGTTLDFVSQPPECTN